MTNVPDPDMSEHATRGGKPYINIYLRESAILYFMYIIFKNGGCYRMTQHF